MPARTLEDSLRWVDQGTDLFSGALAGLAEDAYAESTALPGWTRKHLVAHVAANAVAIGNLVHWAATGEPTPMYISPEQRAADIEDGSRLAGDLLTQRFVTTAAGLKADMDGLSDDAWTHEVRTAQGRTVPASETPWMRAREVMVHAVDLGTGIGFQDLPADFLAALCDDIVAKRAAGAGPAVHLVAVDAGLSWEVSGDGEAVNVEGDLPAIASYLAGRGVSGVGSPSGDVPELPAWL